MMSSKRAEFGAEYDKCGMAGCVNDEVIVVRYVATDRQPADVLTKPLARPVFVRMRDYLLNATQARLHS